MKFSSTQIFNFLPISSIKRSKISLHHSTLKRKNLLFFSQMDFFTLISLYKLVYKCEHVRDESSWEPKYKKAEFILLIFIRIAYCVCVWVYFCIKIYFSAINSFSLIFWYFFRWRGDKEIMGNNDNNYAALMNIEKCMRWIHKY